MDKFAIFLRPYGLASSDELDEVNAEEDELEMAVQSHFPHPSRNISAFSKRKSKFDNSGFSKLCAEAGCLILLLRLKIFLRETYNLSESRCIGFNPDKKEIGEKAILKSSTSSIFDSKLPTYSHKHHAKNDDILDEMIVQYAEFRRLMRSEIHTASRLDESDVDDEVVSEEEMVNLKRTRLDSEADE